MNMEYLSGAFDKMREYWQSLIETLVPDEDGNVCLDERFAQLLKVEGALQKLTFMESYHHFSQYDLPKEQLEMIRSFYE